MCTMEIRMNVRPTELLCRLWIVHFCKELSTEFTEFLCISVLNSLMPLPRRRLEYLINSSITALASFRISTALYQMSMSRVDRFTAVPSFSLLDPHVNPFFASTVFQNQNRRGIHSRLTLSCLWFDISSVFFLRLYFRLYSTVPPS